MLLLLASLVLAACGSASASSPPPTLGSVEATPDELALGTAPSSATSVAPDGAVSAEDAAAASAQVVNTVIAVEDAAADQEPIGPPLSPGSTAEQVLEVVDDLHGPTLDVSGQMNRLLDFPPVPTALDTTITEIRADVGESADGTRFVVTSEVVLVAPGPVDSHVDLYRATFSELGWAESTTRSAGLGTRDTTQVGFKIPESVYENDDFEIVARPADDSSGTNGSKTRIQLRYIEVIEIDGDGSPRSRLEGWVGELPLPAGYNVTGASIQTSDLVRRSLHFSLALRYDGIAPQAIADELRGSLPAGEYAEDERPSMGRELDTWVYLNHSLFNEARVSPHRFGSDTDPVVTNVNVSARVEF
ncbi:MAG: hypothetical protein ACR2QO_11685 [Acidimicrobiales bacterium]